MSLRQPLEHDPSDSDSFQAACGQQVYYNQEGDNYGNIQGELQVASTQTDYNAAECNIWLCKGFKYSDNTDKVEAYTAGQTVDFKFDIRAPHTGTANVSIVDTATNSIIGTPLISWSSFASTASSDYANQTSFSITIPDDLGSQCSKAGACVIQHWWDAASVNQTYESCVDFTVGGSGAGSSSGSSSAASSAVATSSAAATSSVVANTQVATSATSSASATYVASASSSCTSTLTITRSSATASATSSAAASSSTGSASIPDDFTLSDALEWIDYLYANGQSSYSSKAKREARSFFA